MMLALPLAPKSRMELTVAAYNEVRSPAAKFPESTESGSDSREPPQSEEGASARTDASVSREWRRCRCFDDDASVMMDALSVSSPPAVAVL